jgi:hypothetical protein
MRFLLLLLALSACDDFRVCDIPDPARFAQLPTRLSETGIATATPYEPRFPLWADGAGKQRWLALPEGASIDKSDPDAWVFPVGTRAWKELDVDGTRVETRMIAEVGLDDWIDLAYVWLPDGSDAIATPDGAVDALGTNHDVPAAAQCVACHGGRASHLLGISTIQLEDHPIEPAVGYLYANCSHCHNQRRPARHGARCYDPENDVNFDLTLATLDSPPAHETAANHGDEMLSRMGQRGDDQMPPLATKQVDAAGLALVTAYVH